MKYKIKITDESEKKEINIGEDEIIEIKYLEENVKKIIDISEKNTTLAISNPEDIENEYGRLEGFIGDYSFLNGVTGIVGVLCELLYGFNNYRKILLIS